jgi:hypothetical protein
MDAINRIVSEFNRLVALGRAGIALEPPARRVVYYVVATRCSIDIDGSASVFEQDLDPLELEVLINGLRQIGESDLAGEFQRGFQLLKDDGFYSHMTWLNVSRRVKDEIDAIGKRVGDRMWDLDGKLTALLDGNAVD